MTNIDDEIAGRKVIFRWTPTPEDRVTQYDDIAAEYIVVERPDALSGIVVYAKYRGVWDANPFSTRPIIRRLLKAIVDHHGQRADDRCIEDDDVLYAAAGLPPCDRRVGDKAAMLINCARFINRRCESGGWPSYVELEAEIERLKALNQALAERVAAQSELLAKRAEKP